MAICLKMKKIQALYNFDIVSVEDAQEISYTLMLNPFKSIQYIASLTGEQSILKYLLYSIKFKEPYILCGLFRNTSLPDEHLGRLGDHMGTKSLIECLIASSPGASENMVLKILTNSGDNMVKLTAAFRLDLSEPTLGALMENLEKPIKKVLLLNPSLSDSQKIMLALRSTQ